MGVETQIEGFFSPLSERRTKEKLSTIQWYKTSRHVDVIFTLLLSRRVEKQFIRCHVVYDGIGNQGDLYDILFCCHPPC